MKEETYRWGIFQARLDPAEGSEQAGMRPVLVISHEVFNQVMPVVTVLPLTTRKPGRKIYSNEVLLPKDIARLSKDSIILVHQIRTISKHRLTEKYGTLTEKELRNSVKQALLFHLSLEEDN